MKRLFLCLGALGLTVSLAACNGGGDSSLLSAPRVPAPIRPASLVMTLGAVKATPTPKPTTKPTPVVKPTAKPTPKPSPKAPVKPTPKPVVTPKPAPTMPPAYVFIPIQWSALSMDGSGTAIGGGDTNPIVVNAVPSEVQIVTATADPITVSVNTCPASWGQHNPNQTWQFPAQNMVTFNPSPPEVTCQFVITDTVTNKAQTVVFRD